MESATLNFVV